MFLFLCVLAAGQRAREEDTTWCSQLAPQSPPQHLRHDTRPALPAGALRSKQPDQAEGHSQGGCIRLYKIVTHIIQTEQANHPQYSLTPKQHSAASCSQQIFYFK